MIFKEQFIPKMILLELSLNIQMGLSLLLNKSVDGKLYNNSKWRSY